GRPFAYHPRQFAAAQSGLRPEVLRKIGDILLFRRNEIGECPLFFLLQTDRRLLFCVFDPTHQSSRFGRSLLARGKRTVPMQMSFDQLGLSADLLRAVQELGYTSPTPIQQRAIPAVRDGRDLLAAAQTGTGK